MSDPTLEGPVGDGGDAEPQGFLARPRPQRDDAAAPAPTRRQSPGAPDGAPEKKRGFFGSIKNYVEESIAELRKVEWPKQRQLVAGTTVVIVAVIVVGVYLYAWDQAFKHLVQNVFLGQ
jgi:preprotein translocase subunit SecE